MEASFIVSGPSSMFGTATNVADVATELENTMNNGGTLIFVSTWTLLTGLDLEITGVKTINQTPTLLPTSPPNSNPFEGVNSLSVGAKAGIAAGGGCLTIIVLAISFFYLCWKRRRIGGDKSMDAPLAEGASSYQTHSLPSIQAQASQASQASPPTQRNPLNIEMSEFSGDEPILVIGKAQSSNSV